MAQQDDQELFDPLDAPAVDRPSTLSLLVAITKAAMVVAVPLLGALPQVHWDGGVWRWSVESLGLWGPGGIGVVGAWG